MSNNQSRRPPDVNKGAQVFLRLVSILFFFLACFIIYCWGANLAALLFTICIGVIIFLLLFYLG